MKIQDAITIVNQAASLAPMNKQSHVNTEQAMNFIVEYVKEKEAPVKDKDVKTSKK